MSINTVGETNGCTFQWKIVNVSHCYLKKEIVSPKFIADAVKYTKWWLRLCPISKTDENFIGFYLHRDRDCNGPVAIEVNYQITFLDKKDFILKQITESEVSFNKPNNWGYPKFLARNRIFRTTSESILLEDTLVVQCVIWNKIKLIKPTHLYGQTVFNVNRRSLVWKISEFSNAKYGLRKKFKDNLFNFDLVLNEGLDGLDICIISLDNDIRYISYQTSIVDSEGKKEICDFRKYFPGDLRKFVLSPLLSFPRFWMENKSKYIPNDILNLEFDFVFSIIENFEYFENPQLEQKFLSEEQSQKTQIWTNCSNREKTHNSNELINCFDREKLHNGNELKNCSDREKLHNNNELINCSDREKLHNSNELINDLKYMYSECIFSDIELRTSSKTFSVHKNILSARSAVFRKMFSHDMKEAISGHVDITDSDDDTIHRMLLYLYTDSLEDMNLESASKLYISADKYRILSLKKRCSSFIKNNLCPTEASTILALADLYQDYDLKSFVENYILEHEKEVIGSKKWRDFMDANPKLAAYVMYRKFFPDKNMAV